VTRKVLIALAVLLLLAAGAAFWAYHSLDVIVKVALEHYAPDITGVSFKVGKVEVSTSEGRGTVRHVDIGNPPGFSAPRAARLGEVRVAIDSGTLTAAVVHLQELAVMSPEITYERSDKTTNLEVIQKNIESYIARDGGSAASRPAEAKHGRRKFIIDRLAIRGAKVRMTTPSLRGQGITFDLPDIELRDVGKRQGGATASEIAGMVTALLQQRIAQKIVTNIDLLRRGGVEGAVDALRGLLK
jgi:uncharacterized protein involved in outer membrane biogenesis